MLLDNITPEANKAAQKMNLDPITSAVVNIDNCFIAIEDLRLKEHKKDIFQTPTKVIARIPHCGLFGLRSNQIIAEMSYTFGKDGYMHVTPSLYYQMPDELFSEMLKYVETIAWVNNLNGMIFKAPLSFITASKAQKLQELNYHTGHYVQEGFDPVVSIEKQETQPFKFKSDYLELYTQAGGKKIKVGNKTSEDENIS